MFSDGPLTEALERTPYPGGKRTDRSQTSRMFSCATASIGEGAAGRDPTLAARSSMEWID
jgi:hypothetical protein